MQEKKQSQCCDEAILITSLTTNDFKRIHVEERQNLCIFYRFSPFYLMQRTQYTQGLRELIGLEQGYLTNKRIFFLVHLTQS